MSSTIVWFRQDLRIEDNPALTAAVERGGAVIPLYNWAPEEDGRWLPGAASCWWLHHSLISLEEDLQKIGLKLILHRGFSIETLQKLIKQTQADALFWNHCYEPYAIERDAIIKARLQQEGVIVKSFNANLLYEPWEILNRQKKPFQVFTPFWRSCIAQGEPQKPFPSVKKASLFSSVNLQSLPLEKLGLLPKIHWDAGLRSAWKPGTFFAKKQLNNFLEKGVGGYLEKRNYPHLIDGVSHLSPYLHFGEIGPRMIWHAIRERMFQSSSKCSENAMCNEEGFLRQLIWREFAYHILYHFPFTPEQPLHEKFKKFPWKKNLEHLKAWQKGQTGYPLVDAGMRELWATGWMHNRVRMVVGSFLVKDLLLPWIEGAKWFWDTLVDADLANNTLGWQWVAGCGADAAPYFRIFNPTTQAAKFDQTGSYIRKWVPELAEMPNEWIHSPHNAPDDVLRKASVILDRTYPRCIVDHEKARESALKALYRIKNV